MKKVFIFLCKPIARLFFDKKYLKGRWFDDCTIGWRWVLRAILFQKILGFNRNIPWPISPLSYVGNPKNIIFHVDNLDNFQSSGTYFQGIGAKTIIGHGTYIAPNVGLITSNHNKLDLTKHENGKDIIIGKNSWIGMNSIILPGVILGDNTIVGAGSIVTKSFPKGNCVIAGNPTQEIKKE